MSDAGETGVPELSNCWEYKKCGREPGGIRANTAGVCPATKEKQLNGVHGGINAGRACWVIEGSSSKDDKKPESCMSCNFYQMVKVEEGKNLWSVSFMQRFMR